MISGRTDAERNAQRSDEALKFAQVFFQKQDKEKETLYEMYQHQATLIWNGQSHKSRSSIAKFYQAQNPTETSLESIDAQIAPPMGDIVDMIIILAGGKVKQNNATSNFSRTFLLGTNSPGSTEYLIVSDTMIVTG